MKTYCQENQLPVRAKKRYAMVVDLRHCLGCKTCVAACSQANHTPERLWRQVEDLGIIPRSGGVRLTVPVSCMHCEKPACLDVCPTGATRQSDGIVFVDAGRCIGCGYCILACPYRARVIYLDQMDFEEETVAPPLSKKSARAGTCTKCDFCRERVNRAESIGLVPGKDDEATPACVLNCSAGALYFGDLNAPNSTVSRLIREHRTVRLAEEKGTEPQVYYIIDQCDPHL
jgi:phenylacetyl-CoA:acceptor oxidoreductase subunit 1